MFQSLGPFTGLLVAVFVSVVVGLPFLQTSAAQPMLAAFGGGTDGDDPMAAAAAYVGLAIAYTGVVVLVGESASNAGAFGLTVSLLLPFAFGVAAATAWLPLAGVEWRPAGTDRTDATVAFTAFLAVLTATTVGGWLLVR